MESSSPARTPVWERRRLAVPAIAPARLLVLAIVEEFRKALAATHRYEQLKRRGLESKDPAGKIARRIYIEFYSDR